MNYKDAAPLALESGAAAHAVQNLTDNATPQSSVRSGIFVATLINKKPSPGGAACPLDAAPDGEAGGAGGGLGAGVLKLNSEVVRETRERTRKKG